MGNTFFTKNFMEYQKYIIIPEEFLTSEKFQHISIKAKVLYGFLYSRSKLSLKNGWVDENNYVYIIMTLESIAELLKVGISSAVKMLKELEDNDMIVKKRQGLNKPNLIYLKQIDFTKENKNAKAKPKIKRISERENVNEETGNY